MIKKSSNIEKQQLEQQQQKDEEDKQQVQEGNSSKCLYETATMNLKEFLRSKKVQDYVYSINPYPQNSLMKTKNQLISTNIEKIKQQSNIYDLQEGFYSGSTSRRSSVDQNEPYSYQNDASQFNKSQFYNNQIAGQNIIEDKDQEKICIVKQKITVQDEASLNQIKLLKKELQFANKKVKDMQEQLLDVTTGYIRDVNHFKDLALGHLKLNTADFFEVKYFDSTVILDEKTRLLLNDKLDDMKRQFEKRFQEIHTRYKVASNELEKLTKCLNSFLGHNDFQSQLRSVFQQQPNDYLILKAIQDLKGLEFLFNVIEHQKPQYGIKYSEIDKFISKSQASNRQFQYFQKVIEQKYQVLESNYQTIFDQSQEAIKDCQKKCADNDKYIEISIVECLNSKRETIKQQIESKLFDEYDEKRMMLYEEFKFDDSTVRRMEALQRKLAFQKWRFCIQLLMKKQINKKMIINLLNFKNKLKINPPESPQIEESNEQKVLLQNYFQTKDYLKLIIFLNKKFIFYQTRMLMKNRIQSPAKLNKLKDMNGAMKKNYKEKKRKYKIQMKQLKFFKEKYNIQRYNVFKDRNTLDTKITLLKNAFKEICKAVKYEYNLQINETQFKNMQTEKRVKQFLKDISNSPEEIQSNIQLQIDSASYALSVLACFGQSNEIYNQVKCQEVQTNIQSIDLPIYQTEKEIKLFENEYKDIITSNEQFTPEQLQRVSQSLQRSLKLSIPLEKKEVQDSATQTDEIRQSRKMMAMTLDLNDKQQNKKSKLDLSMSDSDNDQYHTDYLETKKIFNKLEKSGQFQKRDSLTPTQVQSKQRSNNISALSNIQTNQAEKGVFDRLWKEGNQKKARLEKLKQQQLKRESQIWQEMNNFNQFPQNQGQTQNMQYQQQQSYLNETLERIKTDPSQMQNIQYTISYNKIFFHFI